MPKDHTARSQVERRGRGCRPGALPLLGSEGRDLGFQGFTLQWQMESIRVAVRECEGRNGVTQVVSWLGYPERSERGTPRVEWPDPLSDFVAHNVLVRDGCL